jgi:uncharacterized protein YjfI (DUF2170 family)
MSNYHNFNIRKVSDLISELIKLKNDYGDIPIRVDALGFEKPEVIGCVNPASEESDKIEFICINVFEK